MALSTTTIGFDLHQLLGADFDPRRTKAYVETNVENDTLMDTSTGETRLGDQAVTIAADGTGSWTTWVPGADGNPTSWQETLVVDYARTGQRDRQQRRFGPYTIAGTSKTVTNKALTSNVATLTTSTAHGLKVGDTITVAISDAVFDGTHTVTAAGSTTTLSYAKTNANVASAAATGTLTSPNRKLSSLEVQQAVPAEYLTTVTATLDTYVTEAEAARDAAVDISNISTSDGVMTSVDSNAASTFRVQQDARHAATYARVVAATTLTSAGIVAAATEAGSGGRVTLLPGATYNIDTPVTMTDVSLVGDGSATLNVATSLGTGVSALTIHSAVQTARSVMQIEGFKLTGPGARSLGVRTAACDGIEVTGKAKPTFRDIRVTQFDSGLVWNNEVGHIYHHSIEITDCYYGVYCQTDTYDYFVTDSRIDGNTFANFACPADQGFAGMTLTNVHMGFAPYGIYQEAAPAAQGSNGIFLQEVIMRHARMESIGNAAIYSDATEDGTNHSVVADLTIEHPGFSWNATYKIAARDKDYAVVLPFTQRRIVITGGSNPFTAGDVNVFRIKRASHDSLQLIGGTATISQVTTNAGTSTVSAYSTPSTVRQRYSSSNYYSAPGPRTTATRPNGYATLLPFRVESTVTFTGIAVEVTTAGNAGALLRLGIYSDTSGKPGSLVTDAGTVAADSTGIKSITGLSITLAEGWYYLAACVQSAATTLPTMRVLQNVVPGAPVAGGGGNLTHGAGWALGSAGQAALPASGSAATPTDTAVGVAVIT